MFRNYLDKIERDEDVRKNLIELRKLLKTEPGSAAWQRDRQRCLSLMLKLLKHEDAKVRKNAALILGEMGCQDALDALFYAYECEEKLFVKSAYLTAMSQLDYRTYLNAFRERMEELMQMEMTPENQKHLNEELKLLRDMLLIVEKPMKHTFTGYSVPSEMILLTSPGMEQLTIDGELQAFSLGVYGKVEKMAVIHVEKANPDIRGLYPMICQQFLCHEFPDAELVNREDDMGLEGLRCMGKVCLSI